MRTTVGVLVAVALIVGGCSGESKPAAEGTTATTTSAPTSTEPATPTPEPTPAVTMPVVEAPDDAPMHAEFSEEGALEFLDYFWEVYTYFQATKDVDTWDAIADPECIFCEGIRTDVLDAPGYWHGVEVEMTEVKVRLVDADLQDVLLDIVVVESGGDLFNESGEFVRTRAGAESVSNIEVHLTRESGYWVMWEVI